VPHFLSHYDHVPLHRLWTFATLQDDLSLPRTRAHSGLPGLPKRSSRIAQGREFWSGSQGAEARRRRCGIGGELVPSPGCGWSLARPNDTVQFMVAFKPQSG
jgi:hypothetical protein